jgi:hypothetical protein
VRSGRQRTFDRLQNRFALKLAHKDVRLATDRWLANMAFAEMTAALNRGWENRDSRSPMLLQLERCRLNVEVAPRLAVNGLQHGLNPFLEALPRPSTFRHPRRRRNASESAEDFFSDPLEGILHSRPLWPTLRRGGRHHGRCDRG